MPNSFASFGRSLDSFPLKEQQVANDSLDISDKSISRRGSLQRLACLSGSTLLSASIWNSFTNLVSASPDVQSELEELRVQSGLPCLTAGLVKKDGSVLLEHCGYRNSQTLSPLLKNDSMHLGSCTKSMTATLVAMFVEAGKLDWGTTLAELCRDVYSNDYKKPVAGTIHGSEEAADIATLDRSEWGQITVQQIIEHTAALPANAPWAFWVDRKDLIKAREEVAAWLLSQKLDEKLLGTYRYSNVGYMLLGHFLERLENKTWEELMTERLFNPLGMGSAGFGSPAQLPDGRDVWGHYSTSDREALLSGSKDRAKIELNKLWKPTDGDNPAVLGPAGTVHASMEDWAKYLRLHLLSPSEPGFPLPIGQTNWDRLHQPREGSTYSGGWIVGERGWADGITYSHNGSNTMWYCVTFVAPKKGVAVFAATNCGLEAANDVDKALQLVLRRWL